MSRLISLTTYKDIANSVSKFGGILFTPIRVTAVACYASGPLKVRLSFRSQNLPPPQAPIYTSTLSNCAFFPADWYGSDTACFDYCSLWSSLWDEISTLASETNSSCWPESLSVAYCTHIIQTKVMFKNLRYPQISMFTATGGLTDQPLVVLG